MSEDYAPTTDEYVNVRSLVDIEVGDFAVHPVIGGWKVRRNWFDRWLAQHDAEVRKQMAEENRVV